MNSWRPWGAKFQLKISSLIWKLVRRSSSKSNIKTCSNYCKRPKLNNLSNQTITVGILRRFSMMKNQLALKKFDTQSVSTKQFSPRNFLNCIKSTKKQFTVARWLKRASRPTYAIVQFMTPKMMRWVCRMRHRVRSRLTTSVNGVMKGTQWNSEDHTTCTTD